MSLAEVNPNKSGLNKLKDKIFSIFPEARRSRNYYDRWNSDHTKLIRLERDDHDRVYRAGLYSVSRNVLFRMFEIAGNQNGDQIHYCLMIESVASQGKLVIQFAYYDQQGILDIHGNSRVLSGHSPEPGRLEHLEKGYLKTSELYPRINFSETVKKFLFNATSANPNFGKQELVPYNADLSSYEPNLLFEL